MEGLREGMIGGGNRRSFLLLKPSVNPFLGGDDGAVAPIPKITTDLRKSASGIFSGEPHREHSGLAKLTRPGGATERFGGQVENLRNRFLDILQTNGALIPTEHIGEDVGRHFHGIRPPGRQMGGVKPVQRPGELSGVGGETGDDESTNVVWNRKSPLSRHLLEDFQEGLPFRRIDSANDPRLDPRDQFAFQTGEFRQGTIRAKDHLNATSPELIDQMD